jgi:hypothetical protein
MILNVKVVGVEGDSVLVKYASENSARSIDEYDAVAYQPKAMGYTSIDKFIEGIKPSLIAQVTARDNSEKVPEEFDLSHWVGHESTHEHDLAPDLDANTAVKNPEVIL